MTARRLVRVGVGVVAAAAVAIQLVPVSRTNPPRNGVVPAPEPAMAVLRKACWDCHSNETRWPWYAYVAPVSWRIADDVREGRHELNFTEWNRASARQRRRVADKVWEEVSEGNMPLPRYVRWHPEARLSATDRAALQVWASQITDFGSREPGAPPER